MNISVTSVIQATILVIALSMDAFVASFAYGTNKIKIPFNSVMVINLICSGLLAIALFLGEVISSFIPPYLTSTICFTILFALGVVKLFDSSIKALIKKNSCLNKKIQFSMFSLCFILDIYANPEVADKDSSRVLSPAESASLAIALSLDGIAVGFGAGLATFNYIEVILLSLILGIIAVKAGCFIGNKIAERLALNLSWLSGVLLIVLAFMKI